MRSSNYLRRLKEVNMNKLRQDAAMISRKSSVNFNKLQAAACIACSAAISIALIAWTIATFF
jgi:hypothetical protein